MAEDLSVTPGDLRNVGEQLADVSASIKQVLSTLQTREARYGTAPWGNDDIGDGFADGPTGFTAQNENVKQTVSKQTQVLDYWATALQTAANTFEQQDDQ